LLLENIFRGLSLEAWQTISNWLSACNRARIGFTHHQLAKSGPRPGIGLGQLSPQD